MYLLRVRFARWTLAHRRMALFLFGLLTLFFAAGIPKVQLKTIFSDLLPQDDPFVQVYKDHPEFGSPLTVMTMIRRTDGDIFEADTLRKIWDYTRDIDLAPAVDHEQILSVTTEKARYAEATPEGIDMRPLMADHPPTTSDELATFRKHVDEAPNVRQFLISRDNRSALVLATFIERKMDYGKVFDFVKKLVDRTQDAHHQVFVAGMPMLLGFVYHYERQMIAIAAVTIAVMVLALIFYMRNMVGVLTPILTSATAAIWAFGFVGWLGISIEPLLMVVPLLLTARSFSHSVQFTERYFEIYPEVADRQRAAELTMTVMMAPSVLGIMTDILGIVVVAAAPIPAMVRHAIFCGMWAVWLIPTGCVLISLLLASLPPPQNLGRFTQKNTAGTQRTLLERALSGVASQVTGRKAWPTTALVTVISGLAIYTAAQIQIGNPVEGTNLLRQDSEFNTAVRAINGSFPGVNTLEIVLEAKDQNAAIATSQRQDVVFTELALQQALESDDKPPRATLSFADYLMEASRLFSGGSPKWAPMDRREGATQAAAVGALMGSSAKGFSHVLDSGMQNSTVSLWYADNKQATVDHALASAEAAIAAVGVDHADFRVRLGTGTIALQEAVNRVVARFQTVIIVGVNLFIFLLCASAYRSITAGIILLIPVNLANEGLLAAMHLLQVGLDVNSLIVAAIGVGVGIDYGIYLLSRICEELQRQDGTSDERWKAAISSALGTTGRAILFTATIMIMGILPWYLMSDLKFVADMGLLLIAIMLINMVLALVVLPLLLWWIRPAFAEKHNGDSMSRIHELTPA